MTIWYCPKCRAAFELAADRAAFELAADRVCPACGTLSISVNPVSSRFGKSVIIMLRADLEQLVRALDISHEAFDQIAYRTPINSPEYIALGKLRDGIKQVTVSFRGKYLA